MITKRVITNIEASAPYLVRWSLWLPFGLSLKLHQILRADDDRCAHDHPWWFLRIILWGGYEEEHGTEKVVSTRLPWRPWAPWRIYWCGTMFRHRIKRLIKDHSWTLVLCGKKKREWGFFIGSGWVGWKDFVNSAHSSKSALV